MVMLCDVLYCAVLFKWFQIKEFLYHIRLTKYSFTIFLFAFFLFAFLIAHFYCFCQFLYRARENKRYITKPIYRNAVSHFGNVTWATFVIFNHLNITTYRRRTWLNRWEWKRNKKKIKKKEGKKKKRRKTNPPSKFSYFNGLFFVSIKHTYVVWTYFQWNWWMYVFDIWAFSLVYTFKILWVFSFFLSSFF